MCLSCHVVGHPRECTSFVEVWSNERCSTDLISLLNGSTVYQFHYESATECIHPDSLDSTPIRRRRMSSTDISLCHECCREDLCNRKLCGIPESNNTNLACLGGNGVGGFPSDTSIAYCNDQDQCFARQLEQHGRSRPNQFNYGCASQVACDRLMGVIPGTLQILCQRCCSDDACNAYICHPNVQGPSETTKSVTDVTVISTTDVTAISTTDVTKISTKNVTTRSTTDMTTIDTTYTDCWDLQTRGGFHQNGIYDIYPSPSQSRVRIRCDMTTDGGGWTILQRRYDGSLNFTRTFQEYEEGFGDVSGEHWLGLRWINLMTSQGAVQMRVDLCRVDDRAGYVVYHGFSVSGPGDNYTLHAGVYRNGSMRDRLRYNDGREFQVSGSCADYYRGGWWYHSGSCFHANLNGGRYNGGSTHGIMWLHFGGYSPYPAVRSSELKIRPLNAPGDPTHPYTCPP